MFAVAVQGKTYEILWPYFSLPKVRKAHVAAQWTLGMQPVHTPVGVKNSKEILAQPLTGPMPPQPVHTADWLPSSMLNATPTDEIAVEVVAVSTASVRPGDAQPAHTSEGFDAVDAVSELAVSHHPAETATHLALLALEILKPKPGPPQRVKPRPPSFVKTRR